MPSKSHDQPNDPNDPLAGKVNFNGPANGHTDSGTSSLIRQAFGAVVNALTPGQDDGNKPGGSDKQA